MSDLNEWMVRRVEKVEKAEAVKESLCCEDCWNEEVTE